MSILLICNRKDPKRWAAALREELPGDRIEIYPEVDDPSSVDFIICWKPKPNSFEEFPNLKVVQSLGAGIEHITLSNEIPEHVRVTRIVDPQLANDLWEFLLAVVMGQLKELPLYAEQQSRAAWIPHSYRIIRDTTIGILGLGQIGALAAGNFAELGFKVLGWANSDKALPHVQSFVGEEGLATCLGRSDFLINILPLTTDTHGILNADRLRSLKKGSFLINAGRGDHLVEKDLLAALEAEHLAGAFLDVFSEEPLPEEHPFWRHPKISITPHVASLTNVKTAVGQLAENYRRFLRGDPLINEVSLAKGY